MSSMSRAHQYNFKEPI